MTKENKVYGKVKRYLRNIREFYDLRKDYIKSEEREETALYGLIKRGNSFLGLEEILSKKAMENIETVVV